MKKLKLHDFHKMEIDKQNQSMLKGGYNGCVCVGYLCGCACEVASADKYSDSYSLKVFDSLKANDSSNSILK